MIITNKNLCTGNFLPIAEIFNFLTGIENDILGM